MCYLPTFNTVECIWQPLWAVGTKLNVLPELRLHDTKWPLIIIVAVMVASKEQPKYYEMYLLAGMIPSSLCYSLYL